MNDFSLRKVNFGFTPYVLVIVSLAAEWCLFRAEVLTDHPSVVATFVKGLIEMGFLLMPYWVLPPKWRVSILVPLWAVSIFFWANVLYFRFYNGLIPFSSLLYVENMDSTLFSSVETLWKAKDLTYILLPLALSFILIATRKRCLVPFSGKIKWIAITGSCICFLGLEGFYLRNHYRLWKEQGIERSVKDAAASLYFVEQPPASDLYALGLDAYVAKNFIQELTRQYKPIELTAEEQAFVDGFLQRQNELYEKPDSVFLMNRDKNLILIIVESLNAEVVGMKVNGVSLTPTLDSLISQDGTISALKVVSQIGDGGSSDGQMLYNVGLLPLKVGAASMQLPFNSYTSLADLLKKQRNVEFIRESPEFWNHSITTLQYGYDRLYSRQDYPPEAEDMGSDEAVFSLALKELPTLRQPFLAEITTLSMHMPFTEKNVPRNSKILAADDATEIEKNYYNSVNYFDSQLRKFLDGLKRENLYDNSVIVIVSDHNVKFRAEEYVNGRDVESGEIVFMAINTGIHKQIEKPVGQCDIFPTLLDIMGVSQNAPWRGVGLSIFNSHAGSALDRQGLYYGESPASPRLRHAYEVSDLLLRSGGN